MKRIKMIVATHKKYEIPTDDMYLPVQVGKALRNENEYLEYKGDNEGENISLKNLYYCELTALYWAWKNLDSDYIGLSHYRRHFSKAKHLPKDISGRISKVLTMEETEKILNDVDVILPKKRKYYIENLYSHYKNTMYVEPLDETRNIISEKYPEYIKEFDKLHKRTSAHMFNMCIMKKEILNEYCIWLFDILFELEKRIPPEKYDKFHARYLGRISELLLDVWINKNNIKYAEVKVIDIERIDWKKKIWSFLMAKIIGKKYDGSF